jgi:hypothetical protein
VSRRPAVVATLALSLALAIAAAGAPAGARTLGAGSALSSVTLEDQHGVAGGVGPDVRVIVLSRDMTAGGVVKSAFAGMDQGALEDRRAVYIADISRMPGMIARMFAIPRMRRRSYRVLLDRDGAATRELPYTEGRPTVLLVESGKIVAVTHPATAEELRAAIRP